MHAAFHESESAVAGERGRRDTHATNHHAELAKIHAMFFPTLFHSTNSSHTSCHTAYYCCCAVAVTLTNCKEEEAIDHRTGTEMASARAWLQAACFGFRLPALQQLGVLVLHLPNQETVGLYCHMA